jgi:hypothetical protein
MIIYNLTVYYQALCEYRQSQDSTQTEGSRNIIGHIIYNRNYFWSIIGKIKIVENVLCDFGVCPG